MNNTVDSRAFNEEELELLQQGGDLYPFTQLVKDHSDDLQLCFRGNGTPKYVSIYFNNREAFKVYINRKVEISYRTARYWIECENEYNSLRGKYHFKPNIDFTSFLKRNNLCLTKKIEKGDDYEKIYTEIIYPMLQNYSENKDQNDYFKKRIYGKEVERSHLEKEKKAQQRLYKYFKQIHNGYFFYDMEYHQKGGKKDNKPDMLGVYFDENGKPKKIVFVEVKSKKESIDDDNPDGSGLYGHLVYHFLFNYTF